MSEKTVQDTKNDITGNGTHLLGKVCEQFFKGETIRFEGQTVNIWIRKEKSRYKIFKNLGSLSNTFSQFNLMIDVNFHKTITHIGIEVGDVL